MNYTEAMLLRNNEKLFKFNHLYIDLAVHVPIAVSQLKATAVWSTQLMDIFARLVQKFFITKDGFIWVDVSDDE